MSWKDRKLDRLKMYSKGATNETRTCAVPNARPTDEFLLVRGGGGEQRVWSWVLKEGTTKAILQACQGVWGGLIGFCKIVVCIIV